jgi:hypothetical protein
MYLLITLGVPRSGIAGRDSWKHYDRGAVAIIDWQAKQIVRYKEYVPHELLRHPDASVEIAYGSWKENSFYAAAPTEVLRFAIPSLEYEGVLTHPTFSDLHHVVALQDRLLVCNTGLAVLQSFSYEGDLLDTFNAASTPTWERFLPTTDYRLEFTTKPRECHINYVFFYDGDMWLTRLLQKDAVCVSDPTDVISLNVGNPHDGIVVDDKIYFTTTNGHLLTVDGPKRQVIRDIDLNLIKRPWKGTQIGWCRGLMIKDGAAYVAYSQLRKTKFIEFARWVRDLGVERYPARIEEIDLHSGKLVDTFVFESATGASIYSISCVPPDLMKDSSQRIA